jgi:arylsulfatase A-like enzyme
MDKLASLQPPWQAPSWYRKRGMQRLLRRGGIHRVAQLAKFKSRPAPAYANAQSATEEAVAMLATAQEPFFLWVHYMDAHWPYFDQEGYESPAELALSWQDRQEGFVATRKKNRQHPSTETMARWVRMYDQALQAIDRQIGRLLYAVEEQVGADTLVIATGDHGEEFFEHGHFGHSRGSLYEEILHVPLIMAHPKFSTPSTIQTPVAQVDIAPTITDLLESHVPESMLGESLLPLITETGTAKTEARPIISECHWGDEVHMVAIRAGEFKFIIDLRERDNWQLYNLCSDPEEKVNLRTQPPGNVPDFASMLDQHLAAVKASNIVAAESPEADEELLYRLRDLGYVD